MGAVLASIFAIIRVGFGAILRLMGATAGFKLWMGTAFLAIFFTMTLNSVIGWWSEGLGWFLTKVTSVVGPGDIIQGVQGEGLLGYFMYKLKIPECFAFIGHIVMLRFLLTKIPFIKW